MSIVRSLLVLDARGVARDNVLLLNVALSFVGMAAITIIGIYKHDSSWVAWFPLLIAVALVSNPPGYGFLFGLLMVDEKDSGVRSALAVTPLPPHLALVVRSVCSVILMVVWPLIAILVIDSTWRALNVSLLQLTSIVAVLALTAPVTSLCIATFATNKVEALSIFKGISFVCLAPVALYFISPDAAYRQAFLVIPSAWGVFAFDAFRLDAPVRGYGYVAGGFLYHAALLVVCVRAYVRFLYQESLTRPRRGPTTWKATLAEWFRRWRWKLVIALALVVALKLTIAALVALKVMSGP